MGFIGWILFVSALAFGGFTVGDELLGFWWNVGAIFLFITILTALDDWFGVGELTIMVMFIFVSLGYIAGSLYFVFSPDEKASPEPIAKEKKLKKAPEPEVSYIEKAKSWLNTPVQ